MENANISIPVIKPFIISSFISDNFRVIRAYQVIDALEREVRYCVYRVSIGEHKNVIDLHSRDSQFQVTASIAEMVLKN